MPFIENGHVYNVGFSANEMVQTKCIVKFTLLQTKFSIGESRGGDTIQTFDTDCGKIGIVICYDVEFPELSRLMADEGMNILFVPFLTDTQNGYTRKTLCSKQSHRKRVLCCYLVVLKLIFNMHCFHI
jgi:hypothetical protein